MHIATMDNYEEISKIFKMYKNIFTYLRQDFIKRAIEDNSVVFEDGVVIIFKKYKRNQALGNFMISKGEINTTQLAARNPKNALPVFKKFLKYVNCPVWATVKEDNVGSRVFHERLGFIKVGDISWKYDTLKGCIYHNINKEGLY